MIMERTYTSIKLDVDNFYENDGTVLDMYSENGTDPYNYSTGSTQRCGNYSAEGDCYNREHIIPQPLWVCGSHGFRCSFHHPNGR
jgi:hypothetical protein